MYNTIKDYITNKINTQGYCPISIATLELHTNSIVFMDVANDLGMSVSMVNKVASLVMIKDV